MLWGRSGNICAFPNCKKQLVMDISETDDISIVGEEAHIVAKEQEGPRGISTLGIGERDKYSNLILLCSIHHKIIDDHPDRYTKDVLEAYKSLHETWVAENLKLDLLKQRDDETYASYIDEFLRICNVNHWKAWTSFLLSGEQPRIDKEAYENLRKVINFIISRIWPKRYLELEAAFYNFKNVANDLLLVFDKHADSKNDEYWTNKFYKIEGWDPELYKRMLDEYLYHCHLIQDLTIELTRAGNYIFDSIRGYLLPNFRINEGVLLVEIGPFSDLSWKTFRVEYQGEQRTPTPYGGLRSFMEIRTTRDLCYGEGINENYFPSFY